MKRENAIALVTRLSNEAVRSTLVDLLSTSEPASIVVELQADPNMALRVLDQLRIATPWDADADAAERYDALNPGEVVSVIELGSDGLWCPINDADGDDPSLDTYETLEAAQAAEDERLRAEGWALATGSTS